MKTTIVTQKRFDNNYNKTIKNNFFQCLQIIANLVKVNTNKIVKNNILSNDEQLLLFV